MIQFERTEVWGFEHAIRGMRNPMNSWDKSDSFVCTENGDKTQCEDCPKTSDCDITDYAPHVIIGENDLGLMRRLIHGGPEHRKFLRQIFVSVDITAPLYWWKEADTYKVGTTANSCSTMHKIHAKEFALDDFSHEHLKQPAMTHLKATVDLLNTARMEYLETKSKDDWWQMIQTLPSSYNQRRTVTLTYENLLSMCRQRKGHKLDEWKDFLIWAMALPYAYELFEEDER